MNCIVSPKQAAMAALMMPSNPRRGTHDGEPIAGQLCSYAADAESTGPALVVRLSAIR
jgi:hypothetical protein